MRTNGQLIDFLISLGYIQLPIIAAAFKIADRGNFIPEELKDAAYSDRPLPIVSGQTISQPSTVAFMLQLLKPKPGQKILDIGFGSGWTTALLSHIVGYKGHVYGIEYNLEIYNFGKDRLHRFLGHNNVTVLHGSGVGGLPEFQPFDSILVSASAKKIPKILIDQLGFLGNLVIPVKNSIIHIVKDSRGNLTHKEFPGFIFVPFIEN